MDRLPAISTIIPTYNQEHFIAEAVDSALNQKYAGPHQIIVVDDCSTDRTQEILEGYGDKIVNIRHMENHGGAAWGRNTGQEYAEGDYIAWLDGDDVWFDKKLATLMAVLDAIPACKIAASDNVYIDQDSNFVGLKTATKLSQLGSDMIYVLEPDWMIEELRRGTNWLNSPSQVMAHRSVVQEWMEIQASEDLDMFIRWAKQGESMAMCCLPLVKFRLGSYGRTAEEREKLWKPTVNLVWQKHFGGDA